MINLFDFIAVDEYDKLPSQTDIKKKVNALELKEIQDLTSQIDQEIVRLYNGESLHYVWTLNLTAKSTAIEFLQSLRKIVEKRAKAIFMESLK